jgi:hypothetical protein
MEDLIDIRGYQLVLTFVWTYKGSNKPDNEIFRFGSFRTKWGLRKWEARFLKYLERELEEEKDRIEECHLDREEIEIFDPNGTFFEPLTPELRAEEILDILLCWREEEFPEDAKGPFVWEGVIRLKMKKFRALVEMPVAIFPFDEVDQAMQWANKFVETLSSRKAPFGNVRLQILDEGIATEESHFFGDDEFEPDEYVLTSDLDPEEEGKKLFSLLMHDLIKQRNQLA